LPIYTYECQLIPGLLQTAEYANAVTQADGVYDNPDVLGQRVAQPQRVQHPAFATRERGESCCIRLAGESPVAVSAGAPRSRSQATSENWSSERDVESP
jgi:hypothetical protein